MQSTGQTSTHDGLRIRFRWHEHHRHRELAVTDRSSVLGANDHEPGGTRSRQFDKTRDGLEVVRVHDLQRRFERERKPR
jgi:hypothetical protein